MCGILAAWTEPTDDGAMVDPSIVDRDVDDEDDDGESTWRFHGASELLSPVADVSRDAEGEEIRVAPVEVGEGRRLRS